MEKVLSLIDERTYLHKTQDKDKQNNKIQQIKLNSYMDPVKNRGELRCSFLYDSRVAHSQEL